MAIYDTEEEQLEQLKSWWQNNKVALISGVAIGIIVIVSYRMWHNYQLQNSTQASQLYGQLLDGVANHKNDSVEKIAEKLSKEYSTSTYASYATLQLVKIKVEEGDIQTAKNLLQSEIKKVENPELRHICRLRLIQLLLADKQYEQGLQLISELDPAKIEGFEASYDELQGDLYLAMDRIDEARNAYQSAIRTGQATPLAQFKLDDIIASLPSEITSPTK